MHDNFTITVEVNSHLYLHQPKPGLRTVQLLKGFLMALAGTSALSGTIQNPKGRQTSISVNYINN